MKKYNNPPIVEAIFTISFRELISEELLEKFRTNEYIKKNYPHDNEEIAVEINLDSSMELKKTIKKDGYLFNSGKNKLVSLKYSHLSFHTINKYGGWDIEIGLFKEVINIILSMDSNIYINKISTKFSNIINLPDDSKYDLSKYLVVFPPMPKQINSDGTFLLNFSTTDNENIINGTIIEKLEILDNSNRLILQIFVEKDVDNSSFFSSFEKLREYKNKLFENVLRLEIKQFFDL